MELYLTDNGFGYGGSGRDIAKALADKSGWNNSDAVGSVGNNQSTNNLSGFSALPSGGRTSNNNGIMYSEAIGATTRWWCAPVNNDGTNWAREVSFHIDYLYRAYPNKEFGQSIRCIKD